MEIVLVGREQLAKLFIESVVKTGTDGKAVAENMVSASTAVSYTEDEIAIVPKETSNLFPVKVRYPPIGHPLEVEVMLLVVLVT